MNVLLRDPALVIADRWQRGLPLVPQPFAAMGKAHDLTGQEVLDGLVRLKSRGMLVRVGAVVRPHSAGASTLAALSCPPHDLPRIARMVSEEAPVNHNYERAHALNLWFVVTSPGPKELGEALQRIAARTGCEVLDLRLERAYHIDLGFRLGAGAPKPVFIDRAGRFATALERVLLAAIEDGLPLHPQPFAMIARRIGWSEESVLASLAQMQRDAIITRLGCVLHHRKLGFTANAMAVWNVPDDEVDRYGADLARKPGVTLCYRRNCQLPHWPYNLFAMVHGTDEHEVRRDLAHLNEACGLSGFDSAILFSRRCFTQKGARFSTKEVAA
jgi:siroheme decarboxylase